MPMAKNRFISIQQLADVLGLSRIAVYKKVKKGQIKAIRVGRTFAIPYKYVDSISGRVLKDKEKRQIEKAVRKTVREYGETLKLLGNT
jgi:excisionase family DNA binding protein